MGGLAGYFGVEALDSLLINDDIGKIIFIIAIIVVI